LIRTVRIFSFIDLQELSTKWNHLSTCLTGWFHFDYCLHSSIRWEFFFSCGKKINLAFVWRERVRERYSNVTEKEEEKNFWKSSYCTKKEREREREWEKREIIDWIFFQHSYIKTLSHSF